MRVETLCPDFRLLDSWRFPITGAAGEFEAFLRVFAGNGVGTDSALANGLFKLRFLLGRWLRLDGGPALPIPGCTETSVGARLDAADRQRDRGPIVGAGDAIGARPIYRFDDEALLEASNRTIHALLHLAWVEVEGQPGRYTAALRVYIKSRGRFSAAYMKVIQPFRHRVVYPAWFRRLRTAWELRPVADVSAR